METITSASLLRKNASELWRMRQQLVTDLQKLDGNDAQAEERLSKGLETVDTAMDERMQQDSVTGRYGRLLNSAPELSQRDMAAVDWMKSAIVEKNPAAFTLEPEEQRKFSLSQPGLQWEQRDTLKATATQAMNVSVYGRFVEHMVETTPVMRAGATVIETATGEDLLVPKTTAFQTAALIAEGVSITESDPTLAAVTLKSYKYAAFWQVGRELADDSPANLLDTLARGAATNLAVAYGDHLANGTGSGQPLGYITAATVGRVSPVGGSASLGAQATVGLGTDNLNFLVGSLAEPYSISPEESSNSVDRR